MAEDLEEQLTEQLASVLSLGEDDDSYDVVPYMASMLASDEDMVQDKANFDETVQDLLTSYGVAEDDEACAELCSKVYLCVQGLVSPSGEPSSASADNEPLALLEAPVVMRDTTGQALTEEQDASVVDKVNAFSYGYCDDTINAIAWTSLVCQLWRRSTPRGCCQEHDRTCSQSRQSSTRTRRDSKLEDGRGR
eukprot:m.283660 g.283660  ORF g.283660 m.283660 type:complete len:193 (+) comp17761_c0_seq9:123-701(+)